MTNFIKSYLMIMCLVLCFTQVNAQNNCKVLLPEIAENYEGSCKNGLANGNGKAKGIDTYDGRFKDGLPHGRGKYTYSTGEYYSGLWKEGKKNGKGKFHYKVNNADSIKYGYWKNDVFVKKIPIKPYKVVSSNNVLRYNIMKVGEGNQVEFSIYQNGAPTTDYRNLIIDNSNGYLFSSGSNKGVDNILFPFTCKLEYSLPTTFKVSNFDADFEIEINEPGKWQITIYH